MQNDGTPIYIIDIQGFKHKDSSFIIKEISVLNVHAALCHHRIIELPSIINQMSPDFQAQVNFTKEHVHGLMWSSWYDNLSSYSITDFLKSRVELEAIILIKGCSKLSIVKNLLPDNTSINLEELGCPTVEEITKFHGFSSSKFHCGKHSKNTLRCSSQNVFMAYN